MKDVTFYWLPNCSTCQKAKGWLDRRGVKITAVRDIKENPLSRKEVEDLTKMLGGPAELFSKRAIKYREMKLNEREVPPAEMIDLMTYEYTFLKRPIMVIGNQATAGFFEKSFDSFLNEHYYEPSQNRAFSSPPA
jgi:arsenate reductase